MTPSKKPKRTKAAPESSGAVSVKGKADANDARFDRLIALLESGGKISKSIRECGSNNCQYYDEWMTNAEKAERIKKAVMIGEQVVIDSRLETIREAAEKGTWQAAAWELERRWPHLFALSTERITRPDDGAVKNYTVELAGA